MARAPHSSDARQTVLLIVFVAVTISWAALVTSLPRWSGYSNAGSAIGTLRIINSAQAAYASDCSRGGFATDLADLARPDPGVEQEWYPNFKANGLNANGVIHAGYVFRLAKKNAAPDAAAVDFLARTCPASTHPPVSSYFASAEPVNPRPTGFPSFATDERGEIFYARGPIGNPIPARVRSLNGPHPPSSLFVVPDDPDERREWRTAVTIVAIAGLGTIILVALRSMWLAVAVGVFVVAALEVPPFQMRMHRGAHRYDDLVVWSTMAWTLFWIAAKMIVAIAKPREPARVERS